jgi:mRNA interferase RelE/StbE
MRERSVRLPRVVQSMIRSLHPDLKRRVRAALDLIRTEPETGKALKGEFEGWRSVRVSRLRIIYRRSTTVVEVAAIGPRASIYLETERRVRRSSPLRSKGNAKGGTWTQAKARRI